MGLSPKIHKKRGDAQKRGVKRNGLVKVGKPGWAQMAQTLTHTRKGKSGNPNPKP